MCGAWWVSEKKRKSLTEAIGGVLDSWPARDRRIFEQAHYRGQSAAQIARSLGIPLDEVRHTLERCSKSMRLSLRPLREVPADCMPACREADRRPPAPLRSIA
jgi:DNA-directed RNA polymerase specialized sigma24 family protein